jgi:hypothetical protein
MDSCSLIIKFQSWVEGGELISCLAVPEAVYPCLLFSVCVLARDRVEFYTVSESERLWIIGESWISRVFEEANLAVSLLPLGDRRQARVQPPQGIGQNIYDLFRRRLCVRRCR